MSAVERTLRLHHRDRTTMRTLYDMAIPDIHIRFDELDTRMDVIEAKIATKEDVAAVQVDVKAILTILKQKFPG